MSNCAVEPMVEEEEEQSIEQAEEESLPDEVNVKAA